MIRCRLIDHTGYDLEARERLLREMPLNGATPHVLLSTCNRIEVYWGEGDVPEGVARHLYRVAAGLESALLGERAIQAQLKQAYAGAMEKYRLSPALHRLFQSALRTGKRVRTETRIAEGAVSYSQITVNILMREQVDLEKKIIGIVGVNKVTEDILRFLSARGAVNVFLSNRNLEKAKALAATCNGTAVALGNKRKLLEVADVLVCATSAPHTLIHRADVPEGKDLLIFDLAFPRDVDPSVGEMENIRLFNLEDVERFARRSLSLRCEEIGKAERIVEEEMVRFYQHQSCAEERRKL